MLVHKKVIKEEDAPCRIPSEFPALLTKPGGELNSLALKQRSPTSPVLAALLGAAAGELTPAVITGRLQLMG